MTTEIEKTFFDTFGIEPREFKSCDVGTFCPYPEKECGTDTCPYYRTYKVDYPTISDRILLKLICLCPDRDEVFFTDVEQLKETLLTSYIKIYKYYTEVERLSDCEKELKHQVRTLFEEG